MNIMNIKPIYTEKSLGQAKNGLYSFWFLPKFSKNQIKIILEKTLDIKIDSIKTQNYKKMITRTMRGTRKTIKAMKKVLITLKSGKIELFEETKSK
ncbi:MAG: 50S ribosomal protein L23 [Patescibacteria group bacterium]